MLSINNVLKIKEEEIYAIATSDVPFTYENEPGNIQNAISYFINFYVKSRQDPIMLPFADKESRDETFEKLFK